MAKTDHSKDTRPLPRMRFSTTGEHAPLDQPGPALLHLAKATIANIVFETARLDHDEVSVVAARRGSRRICRAAYRIERMLGDLGDLPDVEAGKLRLDRKRIDIARLVSHVLDGFADEQRRVIRFEVRDHAYVQADADRVERVVATTIDNALGRMVEAEVLVRLDRRGEWVVLTVAEHGPGLTADQRVHAFDPEPPTGMPLYVGRRVIEAHGGRITVESVPSKGVSYSIELPRYAVRDGVESPRT